MGSERLKGRTLANRCCYGACFAIGFLLISLFLTVMFWIVWCYLGLTIVQVSDTQRRAVVNYSYTTSTTSAPVSRTSLPNISTSENSISKSATTSTLLRGSSRGESSLPLDKRKGAERRDSAKGDFAARVPESASNTKLKLDVATASPQIHKPAIMTSGDTEDGIHARRVSPVATHNLAMEAKDDGRRDASRTDILPTQVNNDDGKNSRTNRPSSEDTVREERRTPPRDKLDTDRIPIGREDIESSRRSDPDSAYRDPDFERDYPRSASLPQDRTRGRYDDEDDVRMSRDRYDKRERGRPSDDRYSKGDTRVYPDDEYRGPRGRSPSLDRYPDDDRRRRGDDDRDRDRDYDDRYRTRDRDYDDRDYRGRDYDDRYRNRDRGYAGPYRYPDERLSSDSKYRGEDRLRDNGDQNRDEVRIQPRDDDRFRDRPYDGSIRDRPYDDARYDDKDDGYRYRPRSEDERYRDGVRSRDKDPISSSRPDDASSPGRRPLPSSFRDDGRVSNYEYSSRDRLRTYVSDDLIESRSRAPTREAEDKYKEDEYRRPPSRYDDRDRIAPTKVRDELDTSRSSPPDIRDKEYSSRSTLFDSRRRDEDRYPERRRDRTRYDDKRKDDEVRLISPSSVRRPSDEREEYRTRLPDERKTSDAEYVERRDEDLLDRRSYTSEDDAYRRSNSRTRSLYDDRDNSRRAYPDDDEYRRQTRPDDDEYKRRGDYDVTDRTRYRDQYDRDDSRDRIPSRDYERDNSRDRTPARDYDRDDSRDRTVSRDYERDDSRDRTLSRDYGRDRTLSRDYDRDRTLSRDYGRDEIRRDPDNVGLRKDTVLDDRGRRSRPDNIDDRLSRDSSYSETVEDRRSSSGASRDRGEGLRSIPRRTDTMESSSRVSDDVEKREKRFHSVAKDPSSDRSRSDPIDSSPERPLSTQDVIEAALRHSDVPEQNSRKVFYPVFDPRVSNLTSPEIIRPSERKGITITSKRRRKRRTMGL